MIPNKVVLKGFKRFKETSVLLDRKLLAFIGANEAGKSSFLEALLSIENTESYENNELTKGLTKDDKDVIVTVEYLLEQKELKQLENFNCIGTPRYYRVWKTVSGELFHGLVDEIQRDKKHREELIAYLIKINKDKRVRKIIEDELVNDNEEYSSLKELFELLKNEIIKSNEENNEIAIKYCNEIQAIINENTLVSNKSFLKNAEKLNELISLFLEKEQQDHPNDVFLDYCDKHRPSFISFDNDEKYLKSNYSIKELESPSLSITNLFEVSGVKISDYLQVVKDKNDGERLRLTDIANENLKKEYCSSWSQSEVYPRFLLDPDTVKIQIISPGSYTEISSRSDGLIQYIALKAFLSIKRYDIPPILLIDEAELHLHYSAQSDLIKEFEKQNIVNSIIYTTHSAGCLPSDLGTGIRVVEPIYENNKDTGYSRLKNTIWQNNGGFSPILFAMGANIIAFTLARKAIIAEGPSETILLPRLLRESNNKTYLDFQVAPGIANISAENVKLFEFEAAKEIYLCDGDIGGIANKNKLINGGIEKNKIIQLEKGHSIEDYVDPEVLIDAVNREFQKSGKLKFTLLKNNLPKSNRIGWIEKQCKNKGLELPSKVRIAENIIQTPSDRMIIDLKKKDFLINIFINIQSKLDVC